MLLDLTRLLDDYGVSHSSSNEWTNVNCPYCGDRKRHLGCNAHGNWSCFKCGKHDDVETLCLLLVVTRNDIWRILKPYKIDGDVPRIVPRVAKPVSTTPCVLPVGTQPMGDAHRRYLRSRGFDPDEIERTWGVMGTGHLAEKGLTHRLVIPVHQNRVLVAWQARDITGLADIRYMSSLSDNGTPIKDTLYGLDQVHGTTVIVIEGPIDVWRLGPGAVALYGIEWTRAQAMLLRRFHRRLILFDNEPRAQRQAEKLADFLSCTGETEIVRLTDKKDPGELTPDEAKKVCEDLLTT